MPHQREPQTPDPETQAVLDFWGVIPAGGAGTRLWPLSRRASPKFLHDLTGSGQSLLQDAILRLRPLCGSNVLI
ncbi:MAG: sugar phosphate nucleotidyltransferase, partial [Ornithinimicrobium sp.]